MRVIVLTSSSRQFSGTLAREVTIAHFVEVSKAWEGEILRELRLIGRNSTSAGGAGRGI